MNMDKTIQFLESRLRDNPKSLLFARLADCYLQKDRVDEAIKLCREGLKNHPSYVTANFILGKAYLIKKDHEKAETELKKVISYDRQFIAAHKLLGDLMIKMGWENKAALHYREALRIDPMNQEFRQIVERYSFDDELLQEAQPEKIRQTKVHPHPYRPDKDEEHEVYLDKADELSTESSDQLETPLISDTESDLKTTDINGMEESALPEETSTPEESEPESTRTDSEPEIPVNSSAAAEEISSQLIEEIHEVPDEEIDADVSEVSGERSDLDDLVEITQTFDDDTTPSIEDMETSRDKKPEDEQNADENEAFDPTPENDKTPPKSEETHEAAPFRRSMDQVEPEEEPLEKTIEDVLNHSPEKDEEDEGEKFEFSQQSFGSFMDHATRDNEDVDGFEAPEAIMDETSDAALEQAVVDALKPFSSSEETPLETESPQKFVSESGESLFEISSDTESFEDFGGITGTDSDLPQIKDEDLVEEAIQSRILLPEEPEIDSIQEEAAGFDRIEESESGVKSPEESIELAEKIPPITDTTERKPAVKKEPFSLQDEADLLSEKTEADVEESSSDEPIPESLSLESDEIQEKAEQAAEEIVESLVDKQDQEKPDSQIQRDAFPDVLVPSAEEQEAMTAEDEIADIISEQESGIKSIAKEEPARKERVVFFDKSSEPESEPEQEIKPDSERELEPPPQPPSTPESKQKEEIPLPESKPEPKVKPKAAKKPIEEEPESEKTTSKKEKTAEPKPKKSKIVSPTLGEIYAAQGQYDKAINVYKTLLEKNPNEEKYKDKISELELKLKQSK